MLNLSWYSSLLLFLSLNLRWKLLDGSGFITNNQYIFTGFTFYIRLFIFPTFRTIFSATWATFSAIGGVTNTAYQYCKYCNEWSGNNYKFTHQSRHFRVRWLECRTYHVVRFIINDSILLKSHLNIKIYYYVKNNKKPESLVA